MIMRALTLTKFDGFIIGHNFTINVRNHITDLYLLGLAVHHGGRLATFDRGIPLSAVIGAKPENLAVV